MLKITYHFLLVSGTRGLGFWAIIVQYDSEIATAHRNCGEKGENDYMNMSYH